MFPTPNGISSILSPRAIITSLPNPDYHALHIEFSAYAQAFEYNTPTNSQRPCTIGAIALTPTGNLQGSYYFMSLVTGVRISRQQWTELPIFPEVISRVEQIELQQCQPTLRSSDLLFEWHPQIPFHQIDNNPNNLIKPAGDPHPIHNLIHMHPLHLRTISPLLQSLILMLITMHLKQIFPSNQLVTLIFSIMWITMIWTTMTIPAFPLTFYLMTIYPFLIPS
jgi:hypothetical protein